MSDWAALLTGIAAIVTSLSGSFVAVFAVTRGSPRERERAAQGAIDRVLGADEDDDEEDRRDAIDAILDALEQKRRNEP